MVKSQTKGFWRLKYTSRKDRFSAKLKGMAQYLRENLNTKDTVDTVKTVIRVVKGWVNYHAISDNQRRVRDFWNGQSVFFYAGSIVVAENALLGMAGRMVDTGLSMRPILK